MSTQLCVKFQVLLPDTDGSSIPVMKFRYLELPRIFPQQNKAGADLPCLPPVQVLNSWQVGPGDAS